MVPGMDFKYWGRKTLDTGAVPCEKCVEIPSDARCSKLCLYLLKLL